MTQMAELHQTRHQRKKHKRSLRRNGGLAWMLGAKEAGLRKQLMEAVDLGEDVGFAGYVALLRARAGIGAK